MPATSEITIPVFKKKFLQFIIVVIHNCYLVLDKTQKRDVDLINKLSYAEPQHHVTLCGASHNVAGRLGCEVSRAHFKPISVSQS
jgi:hypothetical protein